jgi:hypothetical protein
MAGTNSLGLTGGMGTGSVSDLGLGGALTQQRQQETEDERKKRLLGLSNAQGVGSILGLSPGGGAGATRLY